MLDPMTTISVANTAIGYIKQIQQLSTDTAINQVTIDLQLVVLNMMGKIENLAREKNDLEQECVRLRDWSAEKQRYRRTEIATGVFAYIENDFVGKLQNAHKYCCDCFDKQKQSTLQQYGIPVGRLTVLS